MKSRGFSQKCLDFGKKIKKKLIFIHDTLFYRTVGQLSLFCWTLSREDQMLQVAFSKVALLQTCGKRKTSFLPGVKLLSFFCSYWNHIWCTLADKKRPSSRHCCVSGSEPTAPFHQLIAKNLTFCVCALFLGKRHTVLLINETKVRECTY